MPDIRQLLLASSQAQAIKSERTAQLPQQDAEHVGSISLVRHGSTDTMCSWHTHSASLLLQPLIHAGNF